jgi:hypothetical protein
MTGTYAKKQRRSPDFRRSAFASLSIVYTVIGKNASLGLTNKTRSAIINRINSKGAADDLPAAPFYILLIQRTRACVLLGHLRMYVIKYTPILLYYEEE